MSDYVLPDGKEITFDLSKMTYGQWMGLFDPQESDERSDETLARVAGLEMGELKEIPFPAYKEMFAAFLKKTREPLANPN